MHRRFSLAHLTVLGCAPPEMTYIAARAGYDFVSFRLIYMGLPGEPDYGLAEKPEMLKQTKRALVETGVRLLDIELAKIDQAMDFDKYEKAMATAAELGGRHVLSSVWTEEWDFALEAFGKVCDLAKKYGLTVDLEYVPIAGIKTLADTVRFLHQVDRENAGLMVDTHHFHRAQDSTDELDRLPRKWFHLIHLCDACQKIPENRDDMTRILREERLYLGEGGIDVAEIIRHIPKVPCSIELPNLARVKEMGYGEHAFRCLESARKYFAHYGLD